MTNSPILAQRIYRGHLDLACEALADENATLAERVADLETERDAYRELLSMTLTALHQALERERRRRETESRRFVETRESRAA